MNNDFKKTGVSVVLGTYNRLSFLKLTIASIRQELAALNCGSEIIIVDGGSTDGTLAWLAKQKDIITIIQHNRGVWRDKKIERHSWGYFMNLGFKCAQGKYICMLSDDCLVVPGAIKNGQELFEKKLTDGEKVGAIAFFWRNWPKQKKYNVGWSFNRIFVNHGMYLRSVLEKINFIDEDHYFFYYADGDLSFRIWEAGYTCLPSPDSYIEHYAHANHLLRQTNFSKIEDGWDYFRSRWENFFSPTPLGELEKDFVDPAKTVDKFKLPHFLNSFKLFSRLLFTNPSYLITLIKKQVNRRLKK